jgi:cytochrome P450
VTAVCAATLGTAWDAAVARGRDLRAGLERAVVTRPPRWLETGTRSRLTLLRRHQPVLALGRRVAVLTRRDDVLAVLHDPATFPLPYGRRLPGAFVLGLAGPEFERQRAELTAVLDDDEQRLRDLVARPAELRVRAAGQRGYCDVGADLVHPLLDEVVGRMLGVSGPDATTLLRWARAMFLDIFLNLPDLAAPREEAERAAAEMTAHFDRLVSERRAAGRGADDVLGRLLDRQARRVPTALTDAQIVDSLIGLAIGWLWHGAKACLVAVDELLARPDALVLARDAARRDDLDALRRVLWETLRFRPVQPGVFRSCAHDVTLGAGSPDARPVRRDGHLFVGTHSAMWDEAAVPDPARFDATRAEGQYLVFGAGPHRCLGEPIMRVQMPALLAPLLAVDGLHRDPGPAGRLRWDGATPAELRVRFVG